MDYEYKPKRQNYKANGVVFALVLLAIACLIVAGFVPTYGVLVQSLAIILFVPAIYMTGKYLITRYLYRVRTLEDGSVDLDVYAYRGGSKMQLVGRVGLNEITHVARRDKENRRPAKGMERYSYCADILPEDVMVVSITNEDGDCEIVLAYDDTLYRLLGGV